MQAAKEFQVGGGGEGKAGFGAVGPVAGMFGAGGAAAQRNAAPDDRQAAIMAGLMLGSPEFQGDRVGSEKGVSSIPWPDRRDNVATSSLVWSLNRHAVVRYSHLGLRTLRSGRQEQRHGKQRLEHGGP